MKTEDTRPFFSVIVPFHNSRVYISKLLNSILSQKIKRSDLEIILVDDHSTTSYEDSIYDYIDKLNIRFFKSDYDIACPGNAREYGVSKARGKWITFLDHDDAFAPKILKRVKKIIEKYNEPYYTITNFIESDYKTNQVLYQFDKPLGWLHGKFYNLDNFWKKYDIHFPKDMKTQEDAAICAQCNCIMEHLNRTPFYIRLYTYIWYYHTNSLSNSGNSYFEANFKDYLKSTGEVYIKAEQDKLIFEDSAVCGIIEVLGMSYFYIMKFIFDNPENYIKENIEYVRELYNKTKKRYDITEEDIYDSLAFDNAKFYRTIRDQAYICSGDCIPSMSIKDFLDILENNKDDSIGMNKEDDNNG